MSEVLLSVLKYWKAGGITLLVLALSVSIYLAQSRGEERDRLEAELVALQREAQAQSKAMDRLYAQEKDRNDFRHKQDRRLRHAKNEKIEFDDALRSVYDSLRERQAASRPAR